MIVTMPIKDGPQIRIADKDGRGLSVLQGSQRVTMLNENIVDFVEAVLAIAASNAERIESRKQKQHA